MRLAGHRPTQQISSMRVAWPNRSTDPGAVTVALAALVALAIPIAAFGRSLLALYLFPALLISLATLGNGRSWRAVLGLARCPPARALAHASGAKPAVRHTMGARTVSNFLTISPHTPAIPPAAAR